MNLNDARENYYYYSGKASDIVRQMALAGIAVVWLFKQDINGARVIPPALLKPTFLVILALALDFAQYVSGAIAWGSYHRFKEQKVISTATFLAPRQLNWAGLVFFGLKIVVVVIAYVLLLGFLRRQVLFATT